MNGSESLNLDFRAGIREGPKARLTRRELVRACLAASAFRLVVLDEIAPLEAFQGENRSPVPGGKRLATLDFVNEPWVPLEAPLGSELDGRLFTDLSDVTPEVSVTPTDKFYIRTRASRLLDDEKPWSIRLAGQVQQPLDLSLPRLERMARALGLHLMECAGNSREARFGMLSVADWSGVPLLEILDMVSTKPQARRVLISGFDRYAEESKSSIPGASWVFTWEQLASAKAFLATGMNGRPLPKDHGAPVRLVVPGWYGCACIKWVNEITLADDGVEATSQMREYASRTDQVGVPALARDYKPATIETSAIPIRVEKWLVRGKIKYWVVGILWGGSQPVRALEIRCNPLEEYVPVDSLKQNATDPWTFWTYTWVPKKPDTYLIRLRVKDPSVPTKRMGSGYFVRSVEITEV